MGCFMGIGSGGLWRAGIWRKSYAVNGFAACGDTFVDAHADSVGDACAYGDAHGHAYAYRHPHAFTHCYEHGDAGSALVTPRHAGADLHGCGHLVPAAAYAYAAHRAA